MVARLKYKASFCLDMTTFTILSRVQGDEPLLPAQLVRQVAELLVDKPNCSMSTLCEPIHHINLNDEMLVNVKSVHHA
jgi:CMP-2-keto-3-deoxyoctulosonic acid synthetase